MKVLHVNDYCLAGGCETLMHHTVSRLKEQGHAAEVFTADEIVGHRRTPISYIDSRRCRQALRAKLDDFEPDVIHLHNYYHELSPGILAMLGSWRRGRFARIVMTAHDYHLACPNSGMLCVQRERSHIADLDRARRWRTLLTTCWDHRGARYSALKLAQHVWNYRLLRRQEVLDTVICPSRFMQRMLDQVGLPTAYIPNPPPADTAAPRQAGGELRVVFVGRIEMEKGLAEFLHMLPTGFPGQMTIVGDGKELDRCRLVCTQRGLDASVRFTGQRPREEALAEIGAAHVLVLPSRWYENAPVVLLEALAAHTNILVSNLGGMREIVERSGVGFTFDPDDAASLRTALQHIVEQHRLGTLNDFDVSSFLRDFSDDSYLQRLLDVYETGALSFNGHGTSVESG